MNTLTSSVYAGSVMHLRLRPRRHRLKYKLFQLLLDLDELDTLDRRLRLFSRNSFNIFSFHDKDHGDRTGADLRQQVERSLGAKGIDPCSGKILLLTMPRILGYVFNPLSVYFCYRKTGELYALVYEVSNTFGGRHDYVFSVEPRTDRPWLQHACDKQFPVSPFLEMELGYTFRIRPPQEDLTVSILVSDDTGPLLSTVLACERQTLSDGWLARAVVMYPLMTMKVIAGIHWEALRLWAKGVRLWPAREPTASVLPLPAAAKHGRP